MDIRKFDEAIPEIAKYMEYPVVEAENQTSQKYTMTAETDAKKAFFIRFYEFVVAEM